LLLSPLALVAAQSTASTKAATASAPPATGTSRAGSATGTPGSASKTSAFVRPPAATKTVSGGSSSASAVNAARSPASGSSKSPGYFNNVRHIPFDDKPLFRLFNASSTGRDLSYDLKKDSFTTLSSADGRNTLIRFSVAHGPRIGTEWHRNDTILDGTVNPEIHYGVRLFGLLESNVGYPTTSRAGTEYIFSDFIWANMTVTPG
jgi:hypothetical protein